MKIKALRLSVICALISALLLSMVGFTDSCNEMYYNIIRIRILANSDSEEDQMLKLKIRDAVLNGSRELYGEAITYDDAISVTESNVDLLREIAQQEIYNNGFDYDVSLCIRDEFFETRVYDNFTLPAGMYETAVFTVGEGNGQNWWCVLFPQVCVGSCVGELSDTLSDDASRYAYGAENYVIKFKTVEIFEKVKKYLFF